MRAQIGWPAVERLAALTDRSNVTSGLTRVMVFPPQR
jgi:hypothetical protein